jgi:heptosyltransferase-1
MTAGLPTLRRGARIAAAFRDARNLPGAPTERHEIFATLPTASLDLGPRPRILLIRLSAIGDVVVTTPVTRALREAWPDAFLAWVVEEKAADVLNGNPFLNEVIVWPRSSWQRQARGLSLMRLHSRFITDLRRRRFDVAIDFQGLARSAGLGLAAGARHRIGNTNTREGSGLCYTLRVPRPSEPSSRQRCLDLLQPLGIQSRDRRMVVAVEPDDRAFAVDFLARHEVGRCPYICLCPATTWPNKHWREERWAQLADTLRQRLDFIPIFMGGPADLPMLNRIQSAMRGTAVIAAGETSLRGAAALLEGAHAVVSVDTALMHLGVAVGTPVIGLCGPSYWPGFQDYEGFHMIRKPLPCSPCLRHPTCAHFDCMRAIGVEETVRAVALATGPKRDKVMR